MTARVLHAPGTTIPFQPPNSDNVYLIRVPRKSDGGLIRSEAIRMGGQEHSALDLARTLRAELERIIQAGGSVEEDAPLLAEVDEYVAGVEAAYSAWIAEKDAAVRSEKFGEYRKLLDLPPRIAAIEREVQRASQTYRDMKADNEGFNTHLTNAAIRDYVVGWESETLPPYRRGFKGIPEALLGVIPPVEMGAIVGRIMELINPPEELLKNSDSDSSGNSDQASSCTARTPPLDDLSSGPAAGRANGKSAGSAGRHSASTPAIS